MSKQEIINENNDDADSNYSIELELNLEALKDSASKVFDKSCLFIEKLDEGGFHKVFLLKMEDDTEYIGRVAFPEYPYWKTESEVAVMKYVRERTSIRVPKVYHYESTKENPVGQEYIIMERLPGVSLSDVWDKYSVKEKEEVLLQVIEIQCILKKQRFPKIGGIFYDKNIKDFVVGQVIEETFFSEERSELDIKRGPFEKTHDYVMAAIEKEILYNRKYFPEEQWIQVYEDLAALVPNHFNNNDGDIFVLTHGDFHSTNILVDGTKITGVIDWECSGSYPLECFCTYPVWILENSFEELDEKKSEERNILQKFWKKEMENQDPEFINIMNNMEKNEFKSTIYYSAFTIYAETGRISDSLEILRKNNPQTTQTKLNSQCKDNVIVNHCWDKSRTVVT